MPYADTFNIPADEFITRAKKLQAEFADLYVNGPLLKCDTEGVLLAAVALKELFPDAAVVELDTPVKGWKRLEAVRDGIRWYSWATMEDYEMEDGE